jgi:hypothetical protein
VTQVNPNKLIRNFTAKSGNPEEIKLNWEMPVDFKTGEEIIITRRKDAFPVELRNPNYEDRYTDVAQVELFRGFTIYCSHLQRVDNKLILANDNSFYPNFVTEFDVNNKYVGRLIRDSQGNVFRITDNTETELTIENLVTREDLIVDPVEGEFVILAEFKNTIFPQEQISLLSDANCLRVDINSFVAGDKVTINNTIDIEYLTDWNLGATAEETASNIQQAIIASGIGYSVEVYGNTLLIEIGTEETLAVSANTPNILVNNYAVSGSKLFIKQGLYSKNKLRDQVLSFGVIKHFVKQNEGKLIELYMDLGFDAIPSNDFVKLTDFASGATSPLKDRYKSYLEVLTKKPTGLDDETYYYYTGFNSQLTKFRVSPNTDLKRFTADKVAPYITRVFYEDIVYFNSNLDNFSYDSANGEVQIDAAPDLSQEDIQVGDFFTDSSGGRYSIISIAKLSLGIIELDPGLNINGAVVRPTHAAVTRANVPSEYSNIEVNDVFKDLAGKSFRIVGTYSNPRAGVTQMPANSIDVLQGLVDKVVVTNQYLVPFTFDPTTSTVQYGDRSVSLNRLLASFTYNSITGIIQYSGTTINLVPVAIGDLFVDGDGNEFEILEVNQANQTLLLNIALSVSNTVTNDRNGSIIRREGFTDQEGNYLIQLNPVQPTDLLKVAGGNTVEVVSVDSVNARLTINPTVTELSTIVEDPFSGSVIRRGTEVDWAGDILQDDDQGGVSRYGSTNLVQYSLYSNPVSTQTVALSTQDRQFGNYLYGLFPTYFRVLDSSGDLEDVSKVFGNELNTMFSTVNTFELQNANLIPNLPLRNAAQSKGVRLTSETLGIDTRRRIVRDIQSVFNKKGTRQGIFEAIKVLTTWDITNGTGDVREAIIDDSPDAVGLKFHSSALGGDNTRLVDTLNVQSPPAGRFYKGLPGITLPGFFEFTEIIISLPNVALEIGNSTDLTQLQGQTTISDDSADYGLDNSLVGSFLIPNEGNPNDFYQIVANTDTTITVQGSIPSEFLGAKYVVLSPLNLNRFVALQAAIIQFIPFNTVPVFVFTLTN